MIDVREGIWSSSSNWVNGEDSRSKAGAYALPSHSSLKVLCWYSMTREFWGGKNAREGSPNASREIYQVKSPWALWITETAIGNFLSMKGLLVSTYTMQFLKVVPLRRKRALTFSRTEVASLSIRLLLDKLERGRLGSQLESDWDSQVISFTSSAILGRTPRLTQSWFPSVNWIAADILFLLQVTENFISISLTHITSSEINQLWGL